MKAILTNLLLATLILLAGCQNTAQTQPTSIENQPLSPEIQPAKTPAIPEPAINRTEFAQYDRIFRFSAEIRRDWQVEYIKEIRSINIYDPQNSAESIRDKSQIFIRFFEANDFLTLQTVTILNREKTDVHGHPAVRYEIVKKNGVPNFPHQPYWRNIQHKLTDIRLTKNNPSTFYVFTYNPELPDEEFNKFINSLVFHNDRAHLKNPLDQTDKRVTKKPFGIKVLPDNSPVQPEKFSGYHTGIDYETFPEEVDKEISIASVCSGPLKQKKYATGYGGIAVQECLLGDETITVIYGHLKLESITASPGDYIINTMHTIGMLGKGFSPETDGERKHLHLGILKGRSDDIRGYTNSQKELSAWLDPLNIVPRQK